MGEISSNLVAKSSARLSTKNAWALYARRRWKQNGVNLSQIEWGLTEGEARGLFAGQISQPTIDKILDHPRGGFGLGLLILEIRTQTALASFIHSERERLTHAARRHEAEAHEMAEMARHLPAALGLADQRGDRAAVRPVRERGPVRR